MTEPSPGTEHGHPAYDATKVFVGHRELLFSLVHNMLGSVAGTEGRSPAAPARHRTLPRRRANGCIGRQWGGRAAPPSE
ncbi:hypothetical protein ACFRQM_21205 [Streptomyces sp. NPDC056831]|uniref:hypothetical protein n=1 Tax=Streptomyces sp. NPDC056831 TaxID=3345954 RepID=UPI0036C744DF